MNLLNRITQLMKKTEASTFDKNGKQIDALFIGNKFIELNNARKKEYSFHFGQRRLQKLVLLTEIYYMRIHNEALLRQNWEDYKEINGLACSHLYIYNAYNWGEITNPRKIWYPPYYKITQKEYETKIDEGLNAELNQIVEELYNITEFVDSVDLIMMLRVELPPEMSVPQNYAGFGDDFPVDKALIYEKFKEFDFDKLKQFNEQEKLKMNLEV